MFRCDRCQRTSTAHESPEEVVVQGRKKTYYETPKKKKSRRHRDDAAPAVKEFYGWETVKALRVCKACATELSTELADGVPMIEEATA